MDKIKFFETIHNQLIVSCQAMEEEPLYGANIMAKMAKASEMGGAAAIRANGVADIRAIKQSVDLPIIGLIKKVYKHSDVYITPTKKEVEELIRLGVDVVAIDATPRDRPEDEQLTDLIRQVKNQGKLVMADISTLDEGIRAGELGADVISTTLSGYTPYSPASELPDFRLLEELTKVLRIPIIAEGRISMPCQASKALELGAWAVVVGSAITRPQVITESFIKKIAKAGESNEQSGRREPNQSYS